MDKLEIIHDYTICRNTLFSALPFTYTHAGEVSSYVS